MKPEMNPYLPGIRERLNMLPSGNPAREEYALTTLQRLALPILLWFFDWSRHRGEGRSVLMAHVALNLAIRGYKIRLDDLSAYFMDTNNIRNNRYFFDAVQKVASEAYGQYYFTFKMHDREFGVATVELNGERPR